jgi:energy-coupling factor transporter transmembrane protein EcfT
LFRGTSFATPSSIGILDFLHHFISQILTLGPLLFLLFCNNIKLLTLIIILYTITHIGWIINKDYCWYTQLVNKLSKTKNINKKWPFSLESFIKYYLRGDDWLYSEIHNIDASNLNITFCITSIIIIIKNYIYLKSQ